MTRRSTLLGVAVGVVLFALVAGGFVGVLRLRDDPAPSSADDKPLPARSEGAMPRTPPALAAYYGQRLSWKRCGDDTCATMRVPLDYARPKGRTIGIALVKVAATGQRIGSLVVNPGGPGGSGIQYAEQDSAWSTALRRHYDRIGFDPRGVGESDPLECLDTAGTDRVLAADPDPDTAAEGRRLVDLTRAFGEACLARSGGLVRHMSTVEVAKDVDVLRALLEEPRLDWFGASYGTYIGATYADLFPTHVGRMVLDGAVDPGTGVVEGNLVQARGFETALRAYVKDCVAKGDCVVGDSVDAGTARIKALLEQVDRQPLPTSSGRELTEGNALYGVITPLYEKKLWPVLTAALKQAIDDRNGTILLALGDALWQRGADGYTGNIVQAITAVNCLDDDSGIPVGQVARYVPRFEQASPTFGRSFAYSLTTCRSWPIKSGRTSQRLHAKGASPILVVGTTRDPATPLSWARSLARQLDSGVLVTRDGDGHTAYRQGDGCVDTTIDAYLLRGTVPRNPTHC